MKRRSTFAVLFAVCVTATTAHGQSTPSNNQEESQRLRLRLEGAPQEDVQRLILQLQQSPQQPQRRGGGRGDLAVVRVNDGGAWWTNTALVARLGLTDDQKAKIERAFENHRRDLVSKTEMLQKEEGQLARLLETETLDRNAVLTQIDRVILARGELERTNAAMTLEMRESLTRAQWMQLPPSAVGASERQPRYYSNSGTDFIIGQPITPGTATPGQRSPRGGQRQQ